MTEIVAFEEKYADDIAELEKLCFSSPWSREAIISSASLPIAVYLVALTDGVVSGYAGMYAVDDCGQINNIAVSPDHRRRGVGSSLISALVSAAGERGLCRLTLEVRRSNNAAVRLYEKNGFYRVGVRPGYYSAPKEDAILYDKDI